MNPRFPVPERYRGRGALPYNFLLQTGEWDLWLHRDQPDKYLAARSDGLHVQLLWYHPGLIDACYLSGRLVDTHLLATLADAHQFITNHQLLQQ